MPDYGHCIYCKAELSVQPPAEHVLPQMFGTFEDNLTLYCVCAECNNSFSRLELFLGRDSAEAIQRVRFGLKPTSAASEIRGRRLTIRVSEPGGWFGAYAVLDGDDEGVFPTFLPQAAFRSAPEGEWEWILEREFSAERLADYPPPSPQIRVAGGSDEELHRVVDALERLGYVFPKREIQDVPTNVEDGQFHLSVEGIIDEAIFRAIAKIAFNYFAHTNGALTALRREFDPIRSYVRYGTPAGWNVVTVSERPILENERGGQRITDGHILTVGWNAGRARPQSKISFFNAITYVVQLCEELNTPFQLHESGHHMHPQLRLISTLLTHPPEQSGA